MFNELWELKNIWCDENFSDYDKWNSKN